MLLELDFAFCDEELAIDEELVAGGFVADEELSVADELAMDDEL